MLPSVIQALLSPPPRSLRRALSRAAKNPWVCGMGVLLGSLGVLSHMRNIRGKNKALVNAKHDAMFAKGGNSQDSVKKDTRPSQAQLLRQLKRLLKILVRHLRPVPLCIIVTLCSCANVDVSRSQIHVCCSGGYDSPNGTFNQIP
jgi:hypothetical protein